MIKELKVACPHHMSFTKHAEKVHSYIKIIKVYESGLKGQNNDQTLSWRNFSQLTTTYVDIDISQDIQ